VLVWLQHCWLNTPAVSGEGDVLDQFDSGMVRYVWLHVAFALCFALLLFNHHHEQGGGVMQKIDILGMSPSDNPTSFHIV
jgi:hypothetical protein